MPLTKLYDHKEVSDVLICTILDEAVIEYQIDTHGDVYVTDLEFPFWISIESDKQFIRFSTYADVKEASQIKALELVNEANSKIFLLSFYYVEERQRLYGQHHVSYKHGLIREQFLRTARRVGGSFRAMIETLDQEGILGRP